jgi:hypothetical protein
MDLFSIDVIVCISEYLGLDCKSFIDSLEISINLEYLYTKYSLYSQVEFRKVRYLKNVWN